MVNFKVYPEVEGLRSTALARSCEEVASRTGVSIIPCPPTVELGRVAAAVKVPVWGQHVDAKRPGSATGWITPEMIKAAGASGTLLNHSEHRIPRTDVAAAVENCRMIGLLSCVCAENPEVSAAMAAIGPNMIAVEPPELIGGEVSVTDARPEVVENAVLAVAKVNDRIPVLCGAGVKTGRDVKRAVELGAKGVLLASGVVKAKDPMAVLVDLVSGL